MQERDSLELGPRVGRAFVLSKWTTQRRVRFADAIRFGAHGHSYTFPHEVTPDIRRRFFLGRAGIRDAGSTVSTLEASA